jgi:hypothetical protein
VRTDPLSRYHLVSPPSYDNSLMDANTSEPYNGSTRNQLLNPQRIHHQPSSQGSFRSPQTPTCTNHRLSKDSGYLTFLAQSQIINLSSYNNRHHIICQAQNSCIRRNNIQSERPRSPTVAARPCARGPVHRTIKHHIIVQNAPQRHIRWSLFG